jgi:hypothetical protein
MKKILLASVLSVALVNPSFAWYDSYGGFTCGYVDPLTSFLDSVFGPPCPPPVAVVQAPPVVIERPVAVPVPEPVPVPMPVGPLPVPCPTYGYWCW